ncbi:MAG TPA: AAA family ATPase [Spirochaetota bacterium]|nr:AAA family ATPase [Spirochaetota bacterium]HOM38292.1 AAA family ATPase [Spirochaetota bacterium]HPQ48490.1 AAA family ATPase [Spirochaetota bacterium]
MINEVFNNILRKAKELAVKLNHEYVTPEHILFVILHENTTLLEVKKILNITNEDLAFLSVNIDNFIKNNVPKKPIWKKSIEESWGFKRVTQRATEIAEMSGRSTGVREILIAILESPHFFSSYFLKRAGISLEDIKNMNDDIIWIEFASSNNEDKDNLNNKPNLAKYTVNLTKKAGEEEFDRIIERDEIIADIIRILLRRKKNNPLLVGEPGVGKTAIVEYFAYLISKEKVPTHLKNIQILLLDVGKLVAGTRYRGDFEERLNNIITELSDLNNVIVFIDEIHTLVGAGSTSDQSLDAANMLKSLLTLGKVRFIGATTYDDFRKYFEKDKALNRRFQKVDVPEPTPQQTLNILKGIKSYYESFHGVTYTEAALKASVDLSSFIHDRFLPDKAIDIIDEAGAYFKIHSPNKKITPKDIEKIVSNITRMPIITDIKGSMINVKELDKKLKKEIFGQDNAIEIVSNAIKTAIAGFKEDFRPISSLLFVGPTGVGKTELAIQLSKILGIEFIRFDMSEYSEKHSVAKLIGAPPGYVGYEEGGLLIEEVRKKPFSVVLFDEIEKADPAIYNSLLQIMDYGQIRDNKNRIASFNNTIIILTSNAGAKEINKKEVGFGKGVYGNDAMKTEIKKIFNPEFINRLDAIVMFNHLTKEVARSIVVKEINILKNYAKKRNIDIVFNESVVDYIIEKGFNQEFGARNIKRTVNEEIKKELAEIIISKNINKGIITIDLKNNKPSFEYIETQKKEATTV